MDYDEIFEFLIGLNFLDYELLKLCMIEMPQSYTDTQHVCATAQTKPGV